MSWRLLCLTTRPVRRRLLFTLFGNSTLAHLRSLSLSVAYSHTQTTVEMAVATMTPNRMRYDTPFSTSLSQSNSYSRETVSMADSLPSIKFGFEELRDRMALFTARFDDFIERGRKRVLEERNQFRLNVAEVQGQFTTDGLFVSELLTFAKSRNELANVISKTSRTSL